MSPATVDDSRTSSPNDDVVIGNTSRLRTAIGGLAAAIAFAALEPNAGAAWRPNGIGAATGSASHETVLPRATRERRRRETWTYVAG